MQKLLSLVTVVILLAVGWMLLTNFKLEGLQNIRLTSQEGETRISGGKDLPPAHQDDNVVRLATFNIQAFGPTKASNTAAMSRLAAIVRMFDLVAIQEIRSSDPYFLDQFVQLINRPSGTEPGLHYRYVISPPLGRTVHKEQYAFVFDATSIEVDPLAVYTLSDPHDLLHRPPLTAQFRVRGPPADEAFTFLAINVHLDPDEAAEEIDLLANVYRDVRRASQGEDDLLFFGDFNLPGTLPLEMHQLGHFGQIEGMHAVIRSYPTNARGTHLYDNIMLHAQSTVEYTGRAGVFDILRRFNLTTEEVLQLSDHFPVWAEFHLTENRTTARIANRR